MRRVRPSLERLAMVSMAMQLKWSSDRQTSLRACPKIGISWKLRPLPTAGLTTWRAIEIVDKLEPHRDVLVLGTGGVSIFALQFAKSRGARVIVTSSSDEKLERARAIGADFGVNYRLHQDWSSNVMEWTGGRGVDLVVETGRPGTLPESMKATRIGGDIVLVGVLTGIPRSDPDCDPHGGERCTG
jgi:NADPH:quinone reductase-like Zn-dependent oxidoreductase